MGAEWFIFRTGPLTIGAGQGGIFARTREGSPRPTCSSTSSCSQPTGPAQPLHPFSGFTASVCQLRPESRGTVLIRSPDPQVHPAIVANYLAAETDRRCIVEGLRLARRLAATEPLKPYIAEEIEPGPDKVSDEDMLAHARARLDHLPPERQLHDGPRFQPMAVVDPELRVHGLSRPCASPTPRSCRPWSRATPMPPAS